MIDCVRLSVTIENLRYSALGRYTVNRPNTVQQKWPTENEQTRNTRTLKTEEGDAVCEQSIRQRNTHTRHRAGLTVSHTRTLRRTLTYHTLTHSSRLVLCGFASLGHPTASGRGGMYFYSHIRVAGVTSIIFISRDASTVVSTRKSYIKYRL